MVQTTSTEPGWQSAGFSQGVSRLLRTVVVPGSLSLARIRSIKPDFFRDAKLQDIQAEHPELNPMLVFAGLWTVADKNGVFEFEPRTLKLDILPFLNFDMSASLLLLERFSLISRFNFGKKDYGQVTNFAKHQRISGKEAQDSPKFPNASPGSNGEAVETAGREGKGREKEGGVPLSFEDTTPIEVARMFLIHEDICIPATEWELKDTRAGIEAIQVQEKLTPHEALLWLLSQARKVKASGKVVGPGWVRKCGYNSAVPKKPPPMVNPNDIRRQQAAEAGR